MFAPCMKHVNLPKSAVKCEGTSFSTQPTRSLKWCQGQPWLLPLKHGAENKYWRFRHVLRVERDRVRKVALRWTPPGKRINRRAKTTWQHADLRSADGNTGGGTARGTDECKELQPCVPMRTKRIKLVNNLSSCAFKINLQVLHGKNKYSSVCCCSGLSVLQSYAAEPFQSRLNEQRAALGCLSFKLYTAYVTSNTSNINTTQ